MGFVHSHYLTASRCWLPAGAASLRDALAALWLIVFWLAQVAVAPPASAEEQASAGTLVKFVILSRHGVRSPIPKQAELDTWTASQWPVWRCPANDEPSKVCDPGELTPRGEFLAQQMGIYYQAYSFARDLISIESCPAKDDLFFWADTDERTVHTGRALLQGLVPRCDISPYLHKASSGPDRVFHPVTSDGSCRLDPVRAEKDILRQAGGSLARFEEKIRRPLDTAQRTLQCCQKSLCVSWWDACRLQPPPPADCTLVRDSTACLVRHPDRATPTKVQLGGSLRVASTFAELLLLEYANGFPASDVGFGRTRREEMLQMFRLHTGAFELEQRSPYIATLQGSRLLSKILLALQGKDDGKEGTAPPTAKFVAYVGHDTNVTNLASMLQLSWVQPGYQQNQTPPAGALIFELRQANDGKNDIYMSYAAQSLDDMRNREGSRPVRTALFVKGCSTRKPGFPCPLEDFAKLANRALDPNQDCWQ